MKTAILYFLVAILFASEAIAEDKIYKRISLKGTPSIVSLNEGEESPKKVVFWSISTGNLTSHLDLYVTAPKNVKIKAYGAFLRGEAEDILQEKRFHYPIELKDSLEMAEAHSECLPISVEQETEEPVLTPEDFPPLSDPMCDAVGGEAMASLAQTLSSVYGGEWGIGNACAFFMSMLLDQGDIDKDYLCANFDHFQLALLGVICPGFEFLRYDEGNSFKTLGSETPPVFTSHLIGLFRKDSCLADKKSRYVTMVELDTSKVDLSLYPNGLRLSARVLEKKAPSGKEAALKPESEGRYAPRPLMMMNWLGTTCGNKMTVTTWKRFKPKTVTPLNIYALLSYKGMVLNLALVDSALSGGPGTAELFTRDESYGVCFDLVRRRQNKNNYPS